MQELWCFPPWNTRISNHSSHTIVFISSCAAKVRGIIITFGANGVRRRQRLKSHSRALKVGDEDVCGPGSRKVVMLPLPELLTLSSEREF